MTTNTTSDPPPPPRGPALDEALPELMSVTEVAELQGMTRRGVLKMIQTGRLPARRAGDTWVVRRAVAEGLTVDGDVLGDEVGQDAPACSACGWGDRSTSYAALSVHQRVHHP